MKEMLNMLKDKEQPQRRADNQGETVIRSASNGERDLQVWRRKLDDLKSKTVKKEEIKNGIVEKLEALD